MGNQLVADGHPRSQSPHCPFVSSRGDGILFQTFAFSPISRPLGESLQTVVEGVCILPCPLSSSLVLLQALSFILPRWPSPLVSLLRLFVPSPVCIVLTSSSSPPLSLSILLSLFCPPTSATSALVCAFTRLPLLFL